MRSFLLCILILTLTTPTFSQKGWRDHEMEIKVRISERDEAGRLHHLHLNGDIHASAGYALMYVVPEEFERLVNSGLSFEVLKSDLNEYYKDFWTARADQYHNYEQVIALMDSLAANYPGICRKILFGSTPQGRQLACLKISNNVTIDENEPEVIFDGGIHGDEIMGTEVLIRFARYLSTSYGNTPEITDLLNSRELTIYPMVNPDGRANMSRYNSNMVDCNRDWGYMWDGEGNSLAAFSQPETRAMRNCVYNHRYVIHVTYHGGEEIVLFPWGYRLAPPPDSEALAHLASVYSTSSGYTNLPCSQSSADYHTNGETLDYSYGADGSDALTMEISTNKQPPASMIQHYYDWNVPAMIEMIKNAGYGIEGIITDSVTGLPVKAAIFVNGLFPVYSDTVVGDYHKYVTPGVYSLKAVANNYVTENIDNVVVDPLSSTVVNIQLKQAAGHFATKVAVVSIPGNNPLDEANTPAAIGIPDNISYSTGKNGWIILDMQEPLSNIPGDDFIVFEGDEVLEGFTCLAAQTMDGPWTSLGTGNGTTAFDLEYSGLTAARFIKIIDDGDGSPFVANAGFDLDAVKGLEEPVGDKILDEIAGLLDIYPNPANKILSIKVQRHEPNGVITLYNSLGLTLLTTLVISNPLQIDIGSLSKGIYFVKFADERIMEVKKIIKE